MSDFPDRRDGSPDRRNEWLEEQLCEAMAKAMRRVILDPEVIAAVGEIAAVMLHERARRGAGNLVLGTLKAFLSRWVIVGLFVLLLAQFIGLPAAVKVFLNSKGTP